MKSQLQLRYLVRQALIASLYVAMLFVFQWASFGVVQFRIAEVLLLLLFFNKHHWVGIIIGTLIGNLLMSPIALDWIIGTGASLITVFLMIKTKEELLSLLWPAIINGLIVGWQLTYLYQLPTPFIMNVGSVFLGEFVVTFGFGMILLPYIRRNKALIKILSK